MTKETATYTPEQLRAALYEHKPEIFNGLRDTFAQLLSIARTYAPLQKYDVTQQALFAVGALLADYLQLRDGDLVMPTSLQAMMGPTDFRFDAVLTETLEGFSALYKPALSRGDIQLAQQVIDVLEQLTVRSIEIRTLPPPPPGENPVTTFIRGYMTGAIQDGAVRGLDDITMAGARAQSNIGQVLLRKQLYLNSQSTISDLEKLAYVGVAQRKSHVTGVPVRAISEMLRLAVFEPVIHNHTIHSALVALQQVCEMELQFKTPPLDQSLRFALGAFLDLTEPTALANVEGLAVQQLTDAVNEGDSEKADRYRTAIRELNEDLWQHLVAIGKAAATTESFGLFYFNANIGEIAKQVLWLYRFLNRPKSEPVDTESSHQRWRVERFAEQLINDLHWIVGATYWRVFEALSPPINTNLVWEFFPTLAATGIRALDADAPSIAEAAISELKSIALACLDKPLQTFRSAARVAVYIARIGIVAQQTHHRQIYELSLNALREFDQQQLKKQQELRPTAQEYEALLRTELHSLAEGENGWLFDEEEALFFKRITPDDINTFISALSN